MTRINTLAAEPSQHKESTLQKKTIISAQSKIGASHTISKRPSQPEFGQAIALELIASSSFWRDIALLELLTPINVERLRQGLICFRVFFDIGGKSRETSSLHISVSSQVQSAHFLRSVPQTSKIVLAIRIFCDLLSANADYC